MSDPDPNLQIMKAAPAGALDAALSTDEILAQVRLIQDVMKAVMHEGEHYGAIPGTGNKKTLLQPGAQKLTMTFRLAPEYQVESKDLPKGHREYQVICTLRSIKSGTFVGQGVGCCTTMESKYRFRTGPVEFTGRPVPSNYWTLRKTNPEEAMKLLGGRGFTTKKNPERGDQWEIARQGEKVEHDNPADYYNTALKMAKKRAFVDATITATAASDIFTQDVEDMVVVENEAATAGHPAPAPVPPKPTPSAPTQADDSEGSYGQQDLPDDWPTDVAARRKLTLDALRALSEDTAVRVLRSSGWLMLNEGLDDLPDAKLPEIRAQLTMLCQQVRVAMKGPMPASKPQATPTPAPAPARDEGSDWGDGTMEITSVVEFVHEKKGKSDRGPWTKYGVKTTGDLWFGTFDSNLGAVAHGLKGRRAKIRYQQTDRGQNNLVSIEPA